MAAEDEPEALAGVRDQLTMEYPQLYGAVISLYEIRRLDLERSAVEGLIADRRAGAQLRNSYFARIGRTLEPLFAPLGWDWRITMAVLAAFPAREVMIATVGTIFNLGTDVDEESTSLITKMRMARWEDGPRLEAPLFTPAVALSIMVFFALCCQCGATLVTIRRETGSWLYPVAVFSYMSVLAYLGAMATYSFFVRVWY